MVENSMEAPQNIRTGATLSPSNPTSANISEGSENALLKRYLHPQTHSSIMSNSQDSETTKVPTLKSMDEDVVVCYVCAYMQWDITQP